MEIILWLFVIPVSFIALVVWLYRMPDRGAVPQVLRVASNRLWGEYHRLGHGRLWEPGEREVYRTRLLGVTAYTIDRHVQIQRRATCLVTNRTLFAFDSRGSRVRIPARDIRAARSRRTYDAAEGFSYSVVVERVGSTHHEPEGDLRLITTSEKQSQELSSAIVEMQSSVLQV